jgi:hypothetical protein
MYVQSLTLASLALIDSREPVTGFQASRLCIGCIAPIWDPLNSGDEICLRGLQNMTADKRLI